MTINESVFGKTLAGQPVKQISINNNRGIEITVTDRGATLISVKLKNRNGDLEECILGFDTVKEYEEHLAFYGATIGRVGNRTANGEFTLDGIKYNLAKNDSDVNNLHGGVKGFDKVIWNYSITKESDRTILSFKYLSPDADENFPGNLDTEVKYILTDNNELILDYTATTDKRTPVNLTNHAYWNLTGNSGSVLEHNFQIEADTYLPTDEFQIPTGELKSVEGTGYDFRTLRPLSDGIKITGGFDHNFNLSIKKRDKPVNRVYVEEPNSGRSMEIKTTEPGVQLYTGFDDHKFFCLETQMFPNAINNSDFDSIVLSPGETYRQTTIHKFDFKK
ncbi:MAG: galactose mutarotase [Spirochaetaceae bacterium]